MQFEIREARSEKLPTYTSLYLKLPTDIVGLLPVIKQQEVYNYSELTGIVELPINRLLFLVKLLIPYGDVSFKRYIEQPAVKVELDSSSFKVKPYDYQLEGIEYGLAKEGGWLLLDDQGLGKTLQMIYLAEELHKQGKVEHCLVICGVGGLRYNWAEEIGKFSNLSCMVLGQKITKTGKVKTLPVKERCEIIKSKIEEFFVITNAEILQSKDFMTALKKSKTKFDMVIFDEIQENKNPGSKSGKHLLNLKSKICIALTGTVIENEPEDAYLPLKWTGNIKCTFTDFKHMYNVYGGFGGLQVVGHKNLELLNDLIFHCSLRRLKKNVLELPEKIYLTEYVEMGSKQQALYDEVEKGIAEQLDLLPKESKLSILEEITANMRARQVTAWPGILTTEEIPSAKLERLIQYAETVISQGSKAVIFSTFKQPIEVLAKRLAKHSPLVVTGDTPDAEMMEKKAMFNKNPENKLFIGTWSKVGTGFTLTAANYVLFLDTPWNNSKFEQCADRIYRIGQDKTVFIVTFITKGTYDERVQDLINSKKNIGNYIADKEGSDKLIHVRDLGE